MGGDFVADLEIVFVDVVDDSGIGGVNTFFEHGYEYAVELHDGFDSAIEAVHELLGAAVLGKRGLVVENQAVFFAPCG